MSMILRTQLAAVRASATALSEQLAALTATLDALEAAEAEAPSGPRCPKCGSPKYRDLSGGGPKEYQCDDCGKNYAPCN